MKLQQTTQVRPPMKNEFDDELDIDTPSNETIDSPENNKEDDIIDAGDNDFYGEMDGSPSTMQKYSDLLKDLTNFSPIVKDIVNGWLGITWDEEAQKYKKIPGVEPIMNINGATWCISYLKVYAKKTNFITNLGEDEYKWMYMDINRVVWIDFATRDDFGVKNNQDYHRIGMELVHSAILVITGAGAGKYNQFFSSTTTRHENISNQPQGQSMSPMMGQRKKVGLMGLARKLLGGA
jgi:hypothetical protein